METIELKESKRNGLNKESTNKVINYLEYIRTETKGKWVKSKAFFSYFDEELQKKKNITFKFDISSSYGKTLLVKYNVIKLKIIDGEEHLQFCKEININEMGIILHNDVYEYKINQTKKAELAKLKAKQEIAIVESVQTEISFEKENDVEPSSETTEELTEIDSNQILLSMLESNKVILENNNLIIENINKLIAEINKK